MSKSHEPPSAAAGDDRNLVTAAESVASPDFEENVRQFWVKNRGALIAVSVAVVLAIFGRQGWDWYQANRAESQSKAYAAATTDAQRKAFADENAGSQLAGMAHLTIADAAFKDGRFSEAISAYDTAAKELTDTAFASRIRLGGAMAQVRNGDSTGGQSALRDIANDTSATAAVRGEAIYHLASIAAVAGDSATLTALATQATSVDAASTWTQRVSMLQTLVAPAAAEVSVIQP